MSILFIRFFGGLFERGAKLDRVIALIQLCSDWRYAPRFIAWAKQFDQMLKDHGQSVQTTERAFALLGSPPRPIIGRAAARWLRLRGLIVLYRGSPRLAPSEDFLSSIARGESTFRGRAGLEASVDLEVELLALNLLPCEATALYDSEPVFMPGTPPGLWGEPIGGAGIPFSEFLPVAAAYAQGEGERVYVTLQRIEDSAAVQGHGYAWEFERVVLHRLNRSTVVVSIWHGAVPSFGPPK